MEIIKFVLMDAKYTDRYVRTSDVTTYILVAFVVLTVMVGAVKIFFF